MSLRTSRPNLGSGRLLSVRRTLISLSAGLAAGVIVGLLATPRLMPLVAWTVTVAVILTWVWWISWPQDSAGTERLAEEENTTRSTDVWLLAAAVASLAIVVVALVQSSSQQPARCYRRGLRDSERPERGVVMGPGEHRLRLQVRAALLLRRAGRRGHRLQAGRSPDLQRLRVPGLHRGHVVRCL